MQLSRHGPAGRASKLTSTSPRARSVLVRYRQQDAHTDRLRRVVEWHEVAYEEGMSLAGIVSDNVKLEDRLDHVCCIGPQEVKQRALQTRDRFAACQLSEFQTELNPADNSATARWVCLAKGPDGLASADDDQGVLYGLTHFAFDEQGLISSIVIKADPPHSA